MVKDFKPKVTHIISYVPMLKSDKAFLTEKDDIEKYVTASEDVDGVAKGLVWTLEEDKACAHFMMIRGNDLVKHMDEWAEGDIPKRMQLHYLIKDGRYAMIITPDIQETIRRVQLNYQLTTGWPMPGNSKFQVFFAPLSFVSDSMTAFQTIQPYLKSTTKTYLVEFEESMKKIPFEDLTEILHSKRQFIGELKTVGGGSMDQYLEAMMRPE